MIEGVEKAHEFYETSSGGGWLWKGPEYLISVFVSQSIMNIEGATRYCTLESNVYKTLKEAQAITLGAPNKKLRHKGRFDLVLWRANGEPRGAIEIKNQVYSYSVISKDVERLVSVIERNSANSTFQFGALVYYTYCTDSSRQIASKILEKRIKGFKDRAKKDLPKKIDIKSYSSEIHEIDDSAWVVDCLIFNCK